MWYGVLGPTQVRAGGGEAVTLGGTGLRALLGMLVVDAGRIVPATRLIDGLYGANPPAGAANALQSQVSRLRRALGDPDAVEFHPAGYRLAAHPDDTDLHSFERLAAEGRAALAAGDHVTAAERLRDALALWRGTPFADVGAAAFAPGQAARLGEVRLAAIEDRADAELALGNHDEVAAELAPLVAAHPLRERLRGRYMVALAGAGRPAEALATFEDGRRVLADELGTSPSEWLRAVHVAVLRGEVVPQPAAAAPGPAGSNGSGGPGAVAPGATAAAPGAAIAAAALPAPLPAQLTSFVGREDELARVAGLLRDARLVTLIGPGGAGKTRLAVEVAARQTGEVCFVPLAPLADGADVPRAVLAALGIRESGLLPTPDRSGVPRTDPAERVAAALTGRPLLLVMDNCEHVVDNVARLLDRLLGACPELRVLASSREALGIMGETLSPVPALPVPPVDTPAEEAFRYPAVRLFTERAAAVAPGFRLDEGNVEPVLAICRALDGLPLALELAAARLRALPVGEVAARLGGDATPDGGPDRFSLLSRGNRTAEPRHRTLRAVVEWSWDLLDEAEKVLARRLTVFAGGATLAAAERVCDVGDVLDLLTGLAEKSLIEAVDGGRRYRMLETVRAFGAERLAAAGEADRFRTAHAEHFLAMADEAEPHLVRAEQLDWLRRLDDEYDNLHAALRHAIRSDHALALRLIAALTPYWWLRGVRGTAIALADELVGELGTEPPPGLGEEYAMCVLHAASGPPSRDLRVHLKNVHAMMSYTEGMPRRKFLNVLWAINNGPPVDDSTYLVEAYRRHLSQHDEPWLAALMHMGMGYIRWIGGDRRSAAEEFDAAIALLRVIGERWGLATTLSASADLADAQGDFARAAALTDEALALAAELEAPAEVAEMLCRRGERQLAAGAVDAARADFERGLALARRAGVADTVAAAHLGLATLARRVDGDRERARELLEAALAQCPTEGYGPSLIRTGILVEYGRVAELDGHLSIAAAWYRQALDAGARQQNAYAGAEALHGLAGLALRRGAADEAAVLLGAAETLDNGLGPARPGVAALLDAVAAELTAPVLDAALARGRAMTREEIRAAVTP
jgi:predicted ATPase/DNA-binding SARP family transcriptional activator